MNKTCIRTMPADMPTCTGEIPQDPHLQMKSYRLTKAGETGVILFREEFVYRSTPDSQP
jgi:zona occludens toxin (predicted ATPase)